MKLSLDIDSWCDIFSAQAELSNHLFWLRSMDYHDQLFISPSFNAMWQTQPEVIYQDPTYFDHSLITDDSDAFIRYCVNRHNEAENGKVIYQIKTEKGETKWIRDSFMNLCDPKGQSLAAGGIAMDITHQIDSLKYEKDQKVLYQQHDSLKSVYADQLKDSLNVLIDHKPPEQPKITRRERECFQLVRQGYTARQAADVLYISHRTVEKHLDNLRQKFGCKNNIELMAILETAV
jgi:DNA-binding CsgD family transcriptional regulator